MSTATVAALRTGTSAADGVPHVVGVRTDAGEDVAADLVIDATGRRSSLPSLLTDIGARPPEEELEDSGFMYSGRHFRAPDGPLPHHARCLGCKDSHYAPALDVPLR